MLAMEVSTVYTLSTQLNRNVFSCVLKVSTDTSADHSAAGSLFHIDGPQTARRLSLQDAFAYNFF